MPKRQAFTRPTFSQILTFFIVCVAILLIVNLGQKWLVWRTVLAEKQSISTIVEQEQARRDALRERLLQAQSDAYVERIVREDFGWVRENEGSVVLKYEEPAADAPGGTTGTNLPAERPPYWIEWLILFLIP